MTRIAAIFGVAVGLICATPALADDISTITIKGTVQSLTDTDGLLGSAAVGDPFTLIYEVDVNKGAGGGTAGGFEGQDWLTGGSSPSPYYPTFSPDPTSPVSAQLSIDGSTLYFDGAVAGLMYYSAITDYVTGIATSSEILSAESTSGSINAYFSETHNGTMFFKGF
jgi:hypothetical protein